MKNKHIIPCMGEQAVARDGGSITRHICTRRDLCSHYQAWIKEGCFGKEEVSHINPTPCIQDGFKLFEQIDKSL